LAMLVAPEPGVIELLGEDERRETVAQILGRLKGRERRAIELWMEGMSMRGIANELRTTVGAVKMLKFRTMLKLRKQLSGYGRLE